VLFAILPIGVKTYSEAGIDKGDGGDPGAPVDPKLKRKFITTTWVAAVIFAVVWVVITMGWFTLPTVPGGLN
jgi:predicted secreted protein